MRGVMTGLLSVALMLSTAGCDTQPAGDSDSEQPALSDQRQQELAAQAECITKALNDAVLSPQNVKATLDSMMSQSLNGCPTDFTEGFVTLRIAVRDYAQTLTEIEAHNKASDAAIGFDVLNLGCSIFSGQQCAQSSIQSWVDADAALKDRDAASRAAIQSAYNGLEAIAARYGVYISAFNSSAADPANAATNAAM